MSSRVSKINRTAHALGEAKDEVMKSSSHKSEACVKSEYTTKQIALFRHSKMKSGDRLKRDSTYQGIKMHHNEPLSFGSISTSTSLQAVGKPLQ